MEEPNQYYESIADTELMEAVKTGSFNQDTNNSQFINILNQKAREGDEITFNQIREARGLHVRIKGYDYKVFINLNTPYFRLNSATDYFPRIIIRSNENLPQQLENLKSMFKEVTFSIGNQNNVSGIPEMIHIGQF